jgi:AraC family transcriptional regulator, regulatory protein of adaptative response / DNA-3-methyladenine glycosylase II
MLPGADVCYAALKARDRRFDGHFFVGVSSTGIYCRPVCTARTPQRSRCQFFPSPAAAERDGFRPCLRCRPELAPGQSSVDASRRLAQAAASRIDDGALTDASLADLAGRLGVTDRHLRRVFDAEFGVTPVAYVQTQRLLLAKRLLTDTAMPVTDVAMAAGFGSLRRFNDLFRRRYRLSPSDLRRTPQAEPASILEFTLSYRPPYAWEALIDFLANRTIVGVESVAAGVYRRVVALGTPSGPRSGWLAVRHRPSRHALSVTVAGDLAMAVPPVLARVKRLFDLDCRPQDVAAALGTLADATPGLRVPGAFDGFELAVRAILGQQITVRAARTLAGRFAAALGTPAVTPFEDLTTTFPTPDRVAQTGPAALIEIGVMPPRARAIVAMAERCRSGRLVLEPGLDLETTMRALRAIPGVGDWTAQYIAMRALSWPDAFPAADYGVKKAMGESSPARVTAQAESWRPWRAYATMHLWRSLAKETA